MTMLRSLLLSQAGLQPDPHKVRSPGGPLARLFRPLLLGGLLSLVVATGCQKLDPGAAGKVGGEQASSNVSLGKVSYSGSLSEEDRAKVVATVDGQNITMAQLYDEVGPALVRLRTDMANREYSTQRKGVDALIDNMLLEKEASARTMSVDALLKAEVETKVPEPTEEEFQEMFNRFRRRFPPNATLEDVRDDLRQAIRGRKLEEVRTAYLAGLREKVAIGVTLPYPELPTVEVSKDDDPIIGTGNAPVTIIEWSDFQCPYCKRNGETLKAVKEKYGDKVDLVFRDFPLPFHDKAQKASEAAQCANDQGKFWEYHDKLFANQAALDIDGLKKSAEEIGLDSAKFSTCLDSGVHKGEVEKDLAEGKQAGVTGTPASFINGKMVSGALPIETYSAIVESELARLGR